MIHNNKLIIIGFLGFIIFSLKLEAQIFEYKDSTQTITVKITKSNPNRSIKACIKYENIANNFNRTIIFKGKAKSGDYEVQDYIDGLAYSLEEFEDQALAWLAIETESKLFCRLIILPNYKGCNLTIEKILTKKN